MTFTHLPGVITSLNDQQLPTENLSDAPKVLVLGTSSTGVNYQPTLPRSMTIGKSTFGSSGTLARGGFEVKAQGAENVMLMRIGGTAAILVTAGLTITSELLDDAAGTQYSIYYDDSAAHIAIYDNVNAEWVYDNVNNIDTGAVCVDGTPTVGAGVDIGSLSAPVAMASVPVLPGVTATYTAGSDGINPSRMQLYEYLSEAYEKLPFFDMDFIVPMDAYIDDTNLVDLSAGQIAARGLAALVTYPTAGSLADVLGKVYIQEYNGTNYFWWDTDNDGVAEIYPSLGASGPSANIDGDAIASGDFHEVSFGYQLANFCYEATQDWQFVQGFISFKPPTTYCLADIVTWIGRLPTYATDPVTRVVTVPNAASNGAGMLGNKFMAGRNDFRGGVSNGGFILTDSGFVDGTEQTDDNDALVDIGKHLEVCGAIFIHTNGYSTSGYISTVATTVAGKCATLRPSSAPTNKTVRAGKLIKLVKGYLLDRLAGVRIVSLTSKTKGVVITDAPTAARPESDYRRYTTVRIVKEAVDLIREVADPFIGEGSSEADRQALKTAIEEKFSEKLVGDSIIRYDLSISATPAQFAAGQAIANLVLVPKFELRHVYLDVGLSAQQ